MIRLGAYRAGSSDEVDEAIAKRGMMQALLCQGIDEATPMGETLAAMSQIAGTPVAQPKQSAEASEDLTQLGQQLEDGMTPLDSGAPRSTSRDVALETLMQVQQTLDDTQQDLAPTVEAVEE